MRFLCDHMLGTLAKWLRLMGYDTAYPGPLEDDDMRTLAKAEERIVLTRDKELGASKGLKTLYIVSDQLDEQLAQVIKEFDLKPVNPMSLCSVCNTPIEVVEKQEAEGNVPEGVFARQERFWRCPSCGRFYWEGTHWKKIMSKIEELQSR